VVDTVTHDIDPEMLAAKAARRRTNSADYLRVLRGDLDNILRKATAPEARDRYSGATEFAEDLNRYLRHEPIVARPQTAT
jgi:hypothetical protein